MQVSINDTNKGNVLKEILQAVAQGDRRAFETFYDLTKRRIHGIALKILKEPELAEEATMDIYLKIWHLAGSYRPEDGEVTAWSNIIARNRSLDYLRKRRRRDSAELSLDAHGCLDHADLVSPEGMVDQAQRGASLRKAIQSLPEDSRAMVIASFFQDMSHSEIARAFRQPLGTVKTKIRKALEKLRVGLRNKV